MIVILDMTPEQFAKVSAFVDDQPTQIHDSDRFGGVRDYSDDRLTFEKPFTLLRFLQDHPQNIHWNSTDGYCLVEILSTKLKDDSPGSTRLSVKIKFQEQISGCFRGTSFLEDADPALAPYVSSQDITKFKDDRYKWLQVTIKLPLSILAKVMELAGRFPAA